VLALRLHAPVNELRRRMTHREFLTWVAFARLYPVIEANPPDFEANQPITPEIVARIKAARERKG
jgi:hypothetical protein